MTQPSDSYVPVEVRAAEALNLIEQWGGVDGAHHKQWLLNEVVRTLLGSDEAYESWVRLWEESDEEGETYEWDRGIAP